MSKGKRLTNIASGLCGSFASRNNTLDAYWSIGKLRSLAETHGRTSVSFDLLHAGIEPSSSDLAAVTARYRRLLAKLAESSFVPMADIAVANVQVDFVPPPWPRPIYAKAGWGEQYLMTVTIQANGRASGLARHAGYCRPHDPARERQSARVPDNLPGKTHV